MPGNHDDRRYAAILIGPLGQKGNAIGVRHPNIEQHKVRPDIVELDPCRGGISGGFHLKARVFQDVADDAPYIGFIVNDEDVVVVDSHITPAAARALIASIRAITDKPITTLINSHFHYDHAHGAQAFGNVQIIGHEFTREKLTGDPMNEHTFLDSKARFDRTLDRLEARLANVANATARLELETQVEFNRAHIQATKEVTPMPPAVTMNDRLT